ncbi:hypothetical protein ENSA7_54710 [Enhygromyxa salina]|uniref:Uncharacterized protein n=2 Tax=Enhygromyxa salina TaxID=215803 RepID=A0A2S9YC61_9BACT|nr:hypothetical protein ENSA7_54710 [Enhygromyxa salina]
MNSDTTDEEVAQMNWGDISLTGISWIEEGRDIVLHLLVPPTDRRLNVVCRWARKLRIELEFDVNSGYALSWDGEVKRGADGDWEVDLDFAGAGGVSLVCQDLDFRESPD